MLATKEDMLRKVAALIDKANSTTFGAERDAFLAKADQLMAIYAIESFELEFAKPAGQREKPEVREFTYGHTGNRNIDSNISTIFYILAKHVRCKVGWYGWYKSKVVGYPADLDYLDLLFTSVNLHLAMNIEPKPKKELSLGENVAMLKEAGMKWERIHALLKEVGQVPADQHWSREAGVPLIGAYRKLCKAEGRDQVRSNPETYQRNFVEAYVYRIQARLREMQVSNDQATDGKGLVLANRDGDLQEALYEFFPDLRPHPDNCECDTCHTMKCYDPNCDRPGCVEKRKPVRYRAARELRVDYAARSAGRSAAEKADLSGGTGRIGGRQKELN